MQRVEEGRRVFIFAKDGKSVLNMLFNAARVYSLANSHKYHNTTFFLIFGPYKKCILMMVPTRVYHFGKLK